ncbi:hypothetical protein VPH35_140191 [Triticum aestivum]|uniref:F-box domain-containing protein n=1 Tax=Triticum aestivum TaxID=4565 RepID=A0A3B6TYP6_WHEAT
MVVPEELTAMSLPDDMVCEILAHVGDMGDLFHCASTCKRWSRLADDVRRGRLEWTSSFVSGFFTKKGRAKHLTPTPGSVFGPDRRFLGSFFRGGTRDLSCATPLASRHGLLLVLLDSCDARARSNQIIVHLAVCNLLAGTCDELPPLESGWRYGESGYAIFTDADCSSNDKQQSPLPWGYSTLYKVLVIYSSVRDDEPCILHTFSYSEGRWNTPTNLVDEDVKFDGCRLLKHSNAVVCQGTAHWLIGYYPSHSHLHIINVDAETCHVSLMKIMNPTHDILSGTYEEPQLIVSADKTLSLLYLQKPGLQVKICMWQVSEGSESGGRWLCSRVIELKAPKQIRAEEMHLTFLAEKNGTLLVKDNSMNLYAADLRTGVMKSLMYCGKVTYWKVVPFEIYWPVC